MSEPAAGRESTTTDDARAFFFKLFGKGRYVEVMAEMGTTCLVPKNLVEAIIDLSLIHI